MNNESTLRKLCAEFFGPGDCHARDYLFERGFYLDRETRWHVPHGFKIVPKDRRALVFLTMESGFDLSVIEDAEEMPHRTRQH